MGSTRTPEPISLPKLALPKIDPWKEAAGFASLAMDLSWGTLWFQALVARGDYVPNFGTVFLYLLGVMGLSYLLVRLMNYLRLKLVVRRVVLTGVLFGAILIGLRYFLIRSADLSLWDLLILPIRALQDLTVAFPKEYILIFGVLFMS